jgi:hypothetical protein
LLHATVPVDAAALDTVTAAAFVVVDATIADVTMVVVAALLPPPPCACVRLMSERMAAEAANIDDRISRVCVIVDRKKEKSNVDPPFKLNVWVDLF